MSNEQYTRIEIEKACQAAGQPVSADALENPQVARFAHLYRLVAEIGRETGLFLNVGLIKHLTDDEIRAEALRQRSKKNGRKGFAAVSEKYGHKAARSILSSAKAAR
jgi:hypothetical protein